MAESLAVTSDWKPAHTLFRSFSFVIAHTGGDRGWGRGDLWVPRYFDNAWEYICAVLCAWHTGGVGVVTEVFVLRIKKRV